jgi:hypothetical protein
MMAQLMTLNNLLLNYWTSIGCVLLFLTRQARCTSSNPPPLIYCCCRCCCCSFARGSTAIIIIIIIELAWAVSNFLEGLALHSWAVPPGLLLLLLLFVPLWEPICYVVLRRTICIVILLVLIVVVLP